MPTRSRDPRTKEELLDRMLSYDFDGDIRHLGAEPASVVRTGPNRISLSFPASGRTYEFVVRMPRDDNQRGEETRSFAPRGEQPSVLDPIEPEEERRQEGRPQSRSRPSPRA